MRAAPQLILGLVTAFAASAQNVRFETGVTNIHVDALVTQMGASLHGLKQSDFVVRDQGQPQSILAFQEALLPLDLVLLVDAALFDPASISAALRNRPKKVKKSSDVTAAVSEAIKRMRPMDRTAVISYGFEPHFDQGLTSDPEEIAFSLQKPKVPGSPRHFLAIQWAVWLLEADAKARANGSERKRAILMVTGQVGNLGGWYPDEPLIQELWAMDVALYVLKVPSEPRVLGVGVQFGGNFGPTFERLDNPEYIAKATGGEVVVEPPKGSPGQSFPDVLGRIQSSYSLWYKAPDAKPGELRYVTLELSDEAKKKYPGAEIKAREGYIAR